MLLYVIFLGLGYLGLFLCDQHKSFQRIEWQFLSACSAVGLGLFFIIGLIVPSLGWSLLISSIASVSGIILMYREKLFHNKIRFFSASSLLFLSVVFMFALVVLNNVISDWDGLFGYFSHAKIIYSGNGVADKDAWEMSFLTSYAYAYPKLAPYLGAQVGYMMGVWNYVAPNSSILLLIVIAIHGLFAIGRNIFERAILLSCTILLCSHYNWNWYMDSHFAVFATIAFGYILLWNDSRQNSHLFIASAYLGIALGLKNEAVLWLLSLGAGGLVFYQLDPRSRLNFKLLLKSRSFWGAIFLLFAATLFWKARCSLLEFPSYYFARGSDYMQKKFMMNLESRNYQDLFLPALWNEHSIVSLVRMVPALLLISLARSRAAIFIGFFVAVFVYIAGISFIYMISPERMEVQIKLSLGRVLWVIDTHVGFLIYFVIRDFFDCTSPLFLSTKDKIKSFLPSKIKNQVSGI
ncbi:MAG: hypothetical protein H6618_06695 [Deltaproteobacteria bacterium]|nr:hypothetical protein [Deltaproteobacteria bacterium]